MREFGDETVDIKRWLSGHTSNKFIERHCKLYCTRKTPAFCFLKNMLFNYMATGD